LWPRRRWQILTWRVPLHQHDAFDSIAINVLQFACDTDLNIHAGYGYEIAIQNAAIA
jgi:hypothetical protein